LLRGSSSICSLAFESTKSRTEKLCGGSGLGIRERSRFGHTSGAVRLGIKMSTKGKCPRCRSIETSRSHRRGTVERYLLTIIGVRPFGCLNCGVRFYAFARFDEDTSVNTNAACAVFSPESDMIHNNRWQLYRAAVFGINQSKLLGRVKAAEDAIRARASLGEQVSNDERTSIPDAMAALLVLRRAMAQSPVDKIKHHRDLWGRNEWHTDRSLWKI
jgi:hypothetical protein